MQGVPWPASKFYIYSGILIITHALNLCDHNAMATSQGECVPAEQ